MLAAAIRQRHDCKSVASAPFVADAPLTDPDTASRPAPNENHLLINAYTTHPRSPLLAVTRRISDSGCNLVDTRLSTVGRDVSVTALATGSWDSVAKLEAMLTRLEREEGLKLVWYRTGPKPVQSNLLPYVVEVVASGFQLPVNIAFLPNPGPQATDPLFYVTEHVLDAFTH